MQLLYLILASIFFINLTNPKKIKCYAGINSDVDIKNENGKKERHYISKVTTVVCADTCILVEVNGKGKSFSSDESIVGCITESECKSNKKKSSKKKNGIEMMKIYEETGLIPQNLMDAGKEMGVFDKDVTYKISVKCCEKDFCNSGSAFGKMGRYFIGSILLATFLILLL
uniref:UPAR/Ly6 domain-containing protein n=1 Tax=Strongyloides stercoralis TaxID=6248 RepID=A0A0K0DUN0_STRER